jgi:hypothetical protein
MEMEREAGVALQEQDCIIVESYGAFQRELKLQIMLYAISGQSFEQLRSLAVKRS